MGVRGASEVSFPPRQQLRWQNLSDGTSLILQGCIAWAAIREYYIFGGLTNSNLFSEPGAIRFAF